MTGHPLAGVMDKQGMLPGDWQCLRCGRQLNADGHHPAELYAGTFNGLCYPCTQAGPYVDSVAVIDGAQHVSWPPHCPSWRRDRENRIGYPGCTDCGGLGISGGRVRDYSAGASCQACLDRYSQHPLRQWDRGQRSLIKEAAQARFTARLDAEAGIPARTSAKRRRAMIAQLDPAKTARIRAEVLHDYDRILSIHDRHATRLRIRDRAAPGPR